MTKKDKDLAESFQKRRNDPARLEKPAVKVEVKRPTSQVVSFRMPEEEFLGLMEAVEASGQTLTDYVREAVRMRHPLDNLMKVSELDVMLDVVSSTFETPRRWYGNPLPHRSPGIQDYPPKGVAV